MNRELYIHTLSQFRDECERKHMDTETEAFNAAIQALSADGDCISRQAAIDVASGYCHPANIADELRKLPSAQPEPQWIPCSECINYIDERCVVANHHVSEKKTVWKYSVQSAEPYKGDRDGFQKTL